MHHRIRNCDPNFEILKVDYVNPYWTDSLEMDGGNDALNTLVPAVGRYHDARPEIGLSDGQLITLAGAEYGLHPALAGLTPFWEAGTMSAIAGVAMPQHAGASKW